MLTFSSSTSVSGADAVSQSYGDVHTPSMESYWSEIARFLYMLATRMPQLIPEPVKSIAKTIRVSGKSILS